MKPSRLLDFWDKPERAGAPVALLATTFALEPEFFERECLARFLAVSSVEEETGTIDDTVAKLELEERLRGASVTVLADRSTRAERSSFHWDLLHCYVDTGLLHAKVAVLLWENATRVIIGSANLTSAGYRRQIELAMAADLGPTCLLPASVLDGLAVELESYLALVPSYSGELPAVAQARSTLDLLRSRVATMGPAKPPVRVALAPTSGTTTPLDSFEAVWKGSRPLRATHLSPFWDRDDPEVLDIVEGLLTGHPASARSHRVAVTLTPTGGTSFPTSLHHYVDSVRHLQLEDDNIRLLHAKCLLVQSESWVAALVGSSNHTKAGLGLGRQRHRELNIWLGAPVRSEEGKSLARLIPMGGQLEEVPDEPPIDEDESIDGAAAMPLCFGACRLRREGADRWVLSMETRAADMPFSWSVTTPAGSVLATASSWTRAGRPMVVEASVDVQELPLYVIVRWDDDGITYQAVWTVLVEDRHQLPPGLGLVDLRSEHLMRALASGKALSEIVREVLERQQADPSGVKKGGVDLDPLKRLDRPEWLFRRGRALASSLAALERRLSRPVLTLDGLAAHLNGPLGPTFVAKKVREECLPNDPEEKRAEVLFTLAEVALVLSRVPWIEVLSQVDAAAGLLMVRDSLSVIDGLRAELGTEPNDVAGYSLRAIQEAIRCAS